MSLVTQVTALAQAIAADIKDIRLKAGDLTTLSTTAKTSLVAALNELYTNLGTATGVLNALIDDTALAGVIDHTWSVDKIISYITSVKSDIMGGIAPGALDTIFELAAELQNADTDIGAIFTAIGYRVSVDAIQSFDSTQQAQGRSNIGAASAAVLATLTSNVGDTTYNFVAAYDAAKV